MYLFCWFLGNPNSKFNVPNTRKSIVMTQLSLQGPIPLQPLWGSSLFGIPYYLALAFTAEV